MGGCPERSWTDRTAPAADCRPRSAKSQGGRNPQSAGQSRHPRPRRVSQRSVPAQGLLLDQVFEDLERVMPARLHVVSIHPDKADNQLKIKLVVAGRISRPRARAGAQDGKFTTLPADSNRAGVDPAGQTPGDNVQFDISALYVPDGERRAREGHALMPEGLRYPEEGKDCDRRPAGRGHRRRGLAVFSAGGIGALPP